MRFINVNRRRTCFAAVLGLFLSVATLPALAAGTWSALANSAPGGISLMLLLTDGTVMCQNGGNAAWYKLTPDVHGSYVNGTWTILASMNDSRLYYSAQVLRNGRVFVAGGEYGTGGPFAEIYDPIANAWTSLPDAPNVDNFVDSVSETLPNGDVMISPVSPSVYGGTVIWHATSNSWAVGPTLYRGDDQDEAAWVKLPDQSILTIDPFGTNSERYIPALNKWVNDANVPTTMYGWGGEMGAGFLLPNGKAFVIGGTNHTAIYTPSGTTSPGTWTAGANIPNNLGAIDAPAAMMPNGNILCALGTDTGFGSTTYYYEYNYLNNTFTLVSSPTGGTSASVAPYTTVMLDLPDGTVLTSGFGSRLYDYNPGGTPVANGAPVILSVDTNVDGSLLVSGTQLNGISEGAAYGDDWQMDTDYPIGRITNSAGNTLYCRTYDWSIYTPMTGTNVVTTSMTLPPGLLAGTYPLIIVANGISSAPFNITTAGTPLPTVANLVFTTVASNQMVIKWSDINLTETGYLVERSTDGVNYSVVATLSGSTTTYADSNVTPLGQYYYTVLGTNAFGLGLVATPIFAASPPVNAIVAPWVGQDIGPVFGRGASGTNVTGFTVIGSGTSFGTTNDQFQGALQPLAGDATLTARITASQASSANALAGVMMRNSSGDAVASVVMGYDAGNQSAVFEYRAANNGNITTTFSAPGISLPVWVQLVRSGNDFTGYSSPDGSTWTQLGTVQTILPTVLKSGLVSSAGISNLLNTSTFDSVTVSGLATTNPVPIAEWKLDETAGGTATDSRGGFDGTYNNVTLGLPGATPATGYSAGFDGVSSQVAIPPLNLNSNILTITAWIFRTNNESASCGIFFNRANSTVSGLDFYNSAGEVGYTWNNVAGTYNWPSGLFVPSNVWTFIALVITPTNATMYLATNGILLSATNKVSNAVQAFDGASYLGWDTTATNRYFNGQLDEVQLFNQALTAAQLKQFVNPPGVNLTAPANDTITSAFAPVDLSAMATNTSGHTINFVQYFSNDGQVLGTAATAPFAATTTSLAIGNYAIFARLFYDDGYFVDSPLNAVNVSSQPASTNIWDATGSGTGPTDGSGNWGGATVNWWNGSTPVAWTDTSPAVFGAGTSGSYTITITNPVTPYSLTFNTISTYTLAGTNPILLNVPGTPLAITANGNAVISAPLQGSESLLKLGGGILLLSASNSYAGATIVGAGTLRLATNTAFGFAASVTNTGTLDLDGQDFTASMFGAPVSIAGSGIGGDALLNSSAAKRGQLQDITLSGNAAIGGANTIFIGGTNAANGVLDLNGFTLTKNGSGTVILNGLTLAGAGNLTVAAGTLQLMDNYTGGNQQGTTISGNGNIIVYPGASLMTQKWGSSLAVTMPLVLNGGTFGSSWPGPNGATFACPILVNVNSTFNFNGGGYGNCTLSGNITGTGGLTVTGDGTTRTFTGTNSYGWTIISAGTLQIGNGGTAGS
ncbi:MAG TPA: LamG-like jellyroll fold domain-containing protein, partial [Verrucomicrobiae bacterium]